MVALVSQVKRVALGLLGLALFTDCALSRLQTNRSNNTNSSGSGDRRVEIRVMEDGFHPSHIWVERGEPVKLVFTRTAKKTSLEEVIVYVHDTERIQRPLPLGKPVEIDVTFTKTGELLYSCGMGIYVGVVHVR